MSFLKFNHPSREKIVPKNSALVPVPPHNAIMHVNINTIYDFHNEFETENFILLRSRFRQKYKEAIKKAKI